MKYLIFYVVCLALLGSLCVFHLVWGAVHIPVGEVWQILWGKAPESTHHDIIWQIRLPRAVAGILAGCSLAVSGLLMQTFFQNPLAEPSVLGLSSGASLGVAILRLGGGVSMLAMIQNIWGTAISAMLGASLVMLLMLGVATKVKSPNTLLLVGIMVGNFAYAFISLLQHFSSPEAVMDFWRWSMGSVASVTWEQNAVFAWIVFVSLGASLMLSYSLNGWLLGEQYARSMGIAVRQVRLLLIVWVSLLAGVTTAFCGAIGFLGLAIPAPVRAILRTSRHEILLPAVALAGAVVLLFCDAVAKLPAQGAIPLNVMTALIGSPVIVWVILGRK